MIGFSGKLFQKIVILNGAKRSEGSFEGILSAFIYILGSRTHVLYTGVTSDLTRRIAEHKSHLIPGFTRRYNVDRLLYFEELPDIQQAILREKQIKGWTREKKLALIKAMNPDLKDLALPSSDPSLRSG